MSSTDFKAEDVYCCVQSLQVLALSIGEMGKFRAIDGGLVQSMCEHNLEYSEKLKNE
ncbi:MAG: hypothetical protein ACRC62_20290 [Microcoleus sp.]